MSYKAVKATKVGTAALSIGIFHFDPDRDDENGRYQRMILPAEDAARVEKKKLGKIFAAATKSDFDQWMVHISSARTGDAAAKRLEESIDEDERLSSAAISNLQAVAFPAGSPARDASVRTRVGNFDPDAPPAGEDEDADEGVLGLSVAKLKAALADIDSVGDLEDLRADEEKKAKPREGALKAIDDRIAELKPDA